MISLVYHPDERLLQPAQEVPEITAATATLAEQMITCMHDERGIGLAGPQIGHMERIFVVHVPEDEPRVFINPRIIAHSPEEGPYEEGCLSVPGVYADVIRPLAILVEGWDQTGAPLRVEADGLLARVILHEYDHLEGVLFFDHLSPRKRERLLRHYKTPQQEG